MFSKAPIRRFNDVKPTGPPLGAYNPVLDSIAISKSKGTKCFSNTKLYPSNHQQSQQLLSAIPTAPRSRSTPSRSKPSTSKVLSSKLSDLDSLRLKITPGLPSVSKHSSGQNLTHKTHEVPQEAIPDKPDEKENAQERLALLQSSLESARKEMEIFARNVEVDKVDWRKTEDELVEKGQTLQGSLDEMVMYLASLEKQKEKQTGILKSELIRMEKQLLEARMRIHDLERKYDDEQIKRKEFEEKCSDLEREMNQCHSNVQQEMKHLRDDYAEKEAKFLKVLEKERKDSEELRRALERANTEKPKSRCNPSKSANKLSLSKKEWLTKEKALNEEVKILKKQMQRQRAAFGPLTDKTLDDVIDDVLKTKEENAELKTLLHNLKASASNCQIEDDHLQFAEVEEPNISRNRVAASEPIQSCSVNVNPHGQFHYLGEVKSAILGWKEDLCSVRNTSQHLLEPSKINDATRSLIAQIERDNEIKRQTIICISNNLATNSSDSIG